MINYLWTDDFNFFKARDEFLFSDKNGIWSRPDDSITEEESFIVSLADSTEIDDDLSTRSDGIIDGISSISSSK